MNEKYWVQIDGGNPYATDDSARLWAMLYGLLVGAGYEGHGVHQSVTAMVDKLVKDHMDHVEELRDGRTLRVSIIQPGEGDE